MKAIIAVNNLGFIGLNNEIPWRSSEDFKHFKKLTIGSTLLVGYNTFQKLPFLKDRNIVVDTRNSLEEKDNNEDLWWLDEINWCIGGKKTYEKFCHLFTELHISHINDNTIGDCLFPDFRDLNKECKIFNYNFEINETIS